MLFEPDPQVIIHEVPEYVGLKHLAMEMSPILDIPLPECKRMIRLLCELTTVHLEGGRSVHFPGLGKFTANRYKTYYARDPRTGNLRLDEDGNPVSRRIALVYFKSCHTLKRRVHTEHPLTPEELNQMNEDDDEMNDEMNEDHEDE